MNQTSGKRVLFRMEQKEIMITFYNRQAFTNVRAEPQDVIAEMQRRGLTPLKESQIKSWWSMHHQKKKMQMQSLVEEAQQLRQIWYPSAQPPSSSPNPSTVGSTAMTAAQVPLSVPVVTPSVTITVPTATTAAQVPLTATPNVPSGIPAATTTQTVPTLSILNGILEWSFPCEFSHQILFWQIIC